MTRLVTSAVEAEITQLCGSGKQCCDYQYSERKAKVDVQAAIQALIKSAEVSFSKTVRHMQCSCHMGLIVMMGRFPF